MTGVKLQDSIQEYEEFKDLTYFVSHMDISTSMYFAMFDENKKVFGPMMSIATSIVEMFDTDVLNAQFKVMCKNNNAIPFIANRDFKAKKGFDYYIIGVSTDKYNLFDVVEYNAFIYAKILLVYLLDDCQKRKQDDWDLNQIYSEEKIILPHDDYRLVEMDDVIFYSDGIIYQDKAYIYNRLLNKDKIQASDKYPGFARLLLMNKGNGKISFRLDDRLSVNKEDKIEWTGDKFAQYMGPKFDFEKIARFRYKKGRIIKYTPETQNKLLMVIKPKYDYESEETFYDVEIETVPNPSQYATENIITTFIHGKYYDNSKEFRHIDLANNQYSKEEYYSKYYGNEFDKHTSSKELHYKQWRIEHGKYKPELWFQLVSISLTKEYRKLFEEIIYDK